MKKILIIFLSTLSMLLISCPSPNQINDDNDIETVIDNNDGDNNTNQEKDEESSDNLNQKEDEIIESTETFIVTFDSNGGTFVSLQKIEKGKTIKQPQNPTKDNCEFVGWYLGDSLFDFSTPIISDITLKAKWDKIYFTVTFDSDGGTSITPQEVEKGSNIQYFQFTQTRIS